LGGAVFKDGLNFRVKFWMKMKGDSCLVLRMTVWIKGILEFLGEVMDGVKGDSCLVLRMTRCEGEEC
jgi:hypothetical protein